MPKVLVANRGEIAIRIFRSATELEWTTVAIYTENDTSHATFADEVVKLDDVSSFLNVDSIISAAQRTQCTHIHPGYGFLSESQALALSCVASSIIFVGPSPETLRVSSDKLLSRDLAAALGVQIAPGVRAQTSHDVRVFAEKVGYPVMIKALDGGGGRGIRVVESQENIDEAFNRCLGESPSRQLFVEKALSGVAWKHIEVQIIGDGTGEVIHLWERECSVQRRFQKIIETAPSRLPRDVIHRLLNAATTMAKHLKYRGLGTFEFLVNAHTHQWVFLEINPRVQVEHTVTEEILDLDLVRAQLLLSIPSATLASLPILANVAPRGYAIQLRLVAEDPSRSFQLSPGTINADDVHWPAGRGVRVDTWLSNGPSLKLASPDEWTVGTDFDSLLAKIIVRGSTFEETTQKAKRALLELRIGSVKTNAALLAGVVGHSDWSRGDVDTMWLEREIGEIMKVGTAALPNRSDALKRKETGNALLQPGTLFHLTLSSNSAPNPVKHTMTLSSIAHNGFPERLSGTLQTTLSSAPLVFSLSQSSSAAVSSSLFELADLNDASHVTSPLTGKVVELHPALIAAGKGNSSAEERRVRRGETLIVLSVMKMESVVVAPMDGLITRLGKGVRVGVIVGEGMLVCVVNLLESLMS